MSLRIPFSLIDSITLELEKGNPTALANACWGQSLSQIGQIFKRVEVRNRMHMKRDPNTNELVWKLSNPEQQHISNRHARLEFEVVLSFKGREPFYKATFDREGVMQLQKYCDLKISPQQWRVSICPTVTTSALLHIL